MPPKGPCKNPLFLKWLEEIRDEAQAKGSKSYHAYSKGCSALRVYPHVEANPASFGACSGIGAGMIKQLTAKLAAYNREQGIESPRSPDSLAVGSKRHRDPGQNDSPSKKSKKPVRVVDSDEDADVIPTKALVNLQKAAGRGKAKEAGAAGAKKVGGKKMYVPAEGSGGYAILIVMRQEAPNGEKMSREEIQTAAEASGLSITSFFKKNVAEHYTAWNSMKTLTEKDLVGSSGRPAKFWLSDAGMELAGVLDAARDGDPYEQDRRDRVAAGSSQPSGSQPSAPRLTGRALLDAAIGRGEQSAGRRVRTDGISHVRPPPHPKEKFGFHFVHRQGHRVKMKAESRMRLGFVDAKTGEENTEDEYCRIEFRNTQLPMPFVKANIVGIEAAPEGREGGPTSFGWAFSSDLPLSCPGFNPPPPLAQPLAGAPRHLPNIAFPNAAVAGPSRSQPPASSSPGLEPIGRAGAVNVGHASRLFHQGVSRTLSAPSLMTGSGISNLLANIVNSRATQPAVASGSGSAAYSTSATFNAVAGPSNPRPSAAAPKARPSSLSKTTSKRLDAARTNASLFTLDENSHLAHKDEDNDDLEELSPPVTGSSPSKRALPTFEPVVWPAGSYDIVMLLDTREVKSQKNRSGFFDALAKDGMPVEQRALPLGDVLWIARRNDGGGLGTKEDECVLNWVIERKRLDDLVGSIQDGRFHEQKHRMSTSGIENVIYLIEDYAIEQDLWGQSVATAVSSTQVVDGFFVKRTNSIEDSIAYLKGMHETITTVLEYDTLTLLPNTAITRPTYLPLQKHLRATQPSTSYKTSYKAYCDLTSKSAQLTLSEIWGMMLLTISGLSPEKTAAIMEVYPTPRSLWEAYKTVEADEQREEERTRKVGGEEGSGMGKKWKRGDAGRGLLERTVAAEHGSRRSVGKALSAKVWELVRGEEY